MVSEQERLCTQKSYLLSQCEKIDLTAVNRNLTAQHSHPNAAFVETANTRLQHTHTCTYIATAQGWEGEEWRCGGAKVNGEVWGVEV